MRKTKRQIKQLREQIKKLREEEDLTFQEIADILGLKNHQIVQYHYKLSTGKNLQIKSK